MEQSTWRRFVILVSGWRYKNDICLGGFAPVSTGFQSYQEDEKAIMNDHVQ